MYAHKAQPKEHRSRTFANSVSQKKRRVRVKKFEDSQRSMKRELWHSVHTKESSNTDMRTVKQLIPINKEFVKTELNKDDKGKDALNTLDKVKVIEYQKLTFNGTPKNSFATTLPSTVPPTIFINEKANTSDETASLTLYHEAQHAFDPNTPKADDDTEAALKQDIINEVNVLRKEAEYAIERGGKFLESAKDNDDVIETSNGKYEPNEPYYLTMLSSDTYSNYALVKRSKRFDINEYTVEGGRDLSGDWVVK